MANCVCGAVFFFILYYLIGPNLSNCPQQSSTIFLRQAWKRRCLSYHWDVLLKVSTCDWESRKYYSHVIEQSSIAKLNQFFCCHVTMAAADGHQNPGSGSLNAVRPSPAVTAVHRATDSADTQSEPESISLITQVFLLDHKAQTHIF